MVRAISQVVTCVSCNKRNRVPQAASGIPRCAQCKSLLPWIAEADDQSFKSATVTSPVPVVVDLWAPWCGPCRQISPALADIASDMAGKIKLLKVNVDIAPSISQRFEVQGIPTLLILNRGVEVSRTVGARPANALQSWINQSIVGIAKH